MSDNIITPSLDNQEDKPRVQSSKDLIDQYKLKFQSLKLNASESDNNLKFNGELPKVEKEDTNKDQYLKDLLEFREKKYEYPSLDDNNNHKTAVIQQKQAISKLLISNGKVELPKYDPIPQSNYTSILDKFRSASTLDDIQNCFSNQNLRSPFKEHNEIPESTITYELRKHQQKKSEPQLLLKTPMREIENKGFTFIRKKEILSNKNQNNNCFQQVKDNFREQYLSTKIQQQMTIQMDTKEGTKTTKRRDDLYSFLGQIGLGQQQQQQQQQQNEQQQNRKEKNNGLMDLWSGRSSKQQQQQDRDRSKSNGRDSLTLRDQSLKSLHMKMVHHQRQASNKL